MYSGVNPFCDCAFTEAPRCTSNCTTSSCPAERRYRCHVNYSSRGKLFRDVRYRRLRKPPREVNVYLKSFASLSRMHLTSDEVREEMRMRRRKGDREMGMYAHLPREAMCNAVFPFLVAASTIAPRFRSSLTISKWPSLAAKCKAFKPFCNI